MARGLVACPIRLPRLEEAYADAGAIPAAPGPADFPLFPDYLFMMPPQGGRRLSFTLHAGSGPANLSFDS